MRIYAYLRVSTVEQDVKRAKKNLETFIQSYNKEINSFFLK